MQQTPKRWNGGTNARRALPASRRRRECLWKHFVGISVRRGNCKEEAHMPQGIFEERVSPHGIFHVSRGASFPQPARSSCQIIPNLFWRCNGRGKDPSGVCGQPPQLISDLSYSLPRCQLPLLVTSLIKIQLMPSLSFPHPLVISFLS